MNAAQLILSSILYASGVVLAVRLLRATAGRVFGAVAGGVAIAVAAMLWLALGERAEWWSLGARSPLNDALLFVNFAVSSPLFPLLSWRVARRLGGTGLAAMTVLAAALGPPRDAVYVAMFPEWMSYGPGPAPYLAVAAFYAGAVLIGHGVMWLVSGPSATTSLSGNEPPGETNDDRRRDSMAAPRHGSRPSSRP